MATHPMSHIDWELQETTILELEIKNALMTNSMNALGQDLLKEMLAICQRYRAQLKKGLID
jgi:hypothetical protein